MPQSTTRQQLHWRKVLDDKCNNFIPNTGYSVWPEGKFLINSSTAALSTSKPQSKILFSHVYVEWVGSNHLFHSISPNFCPYYSPRPTCKTDVPCDFFLHEDTMIPSIAFFNGQRESIPSFFTRRKRKLQNHILFYFNIFNIIWIFSSHVFCSLTFLFRMFLKSIHFVFASAWHYLDVCPCR